jgi:hypothetical protein
MAETGWWHTDRQRDVRLRLQQNSPITRRLSGDRGEVWSTQTELSIRDWRAYGGWRLASELLLARRHGYSALTEDPAAIRLSESGVITAGSLHVEAPFTPTVAAKIEFPFARAATHSVNTPLACGLRGVIADRLWFSGEWRSGSYGVPLHSEVEKELIHVSPNVKHETTYLHARVRAWHGLAGEVSYRGSSGEPNASLSGASHDEFLPQGDLYLRQFSIEWRGLASRFDLIARHTNCDVRGGGNGYWGGQRYFRMSHSSVRLDGWLAATQVRLGNGRMQLDVASSDFSGFVRVDGEGWRFGRSDFIAGKKVFQVSGDGVLQRFRLGYEQARSPARLCGAFTWYEIRPSASWESWTKIVVVRQDYEQNRASGRYSVAAFSLGGEARWRDLALELGLRQFVHFDDHRKAPEERPAVPGLPSGPGESSERPSGWYGGTFLETSLSRRF